jgi:hypothetical protein
LRHKILNKVIDVFTYCACEKSKGHYCAQVFFGMRTEYEFPDIYLDLIRQHGIPSILQRDNAKSKISHCVVSDKCIAIYLFRTEPHRPWQNPPELIGVKVLKSHSQVLSDITDVPYSMWILAQDYLEHAHSLSATGFIGGTKHFPHPDVLLV